MLYLNMVWADDNKAPAHPRHASEPPSYPRNRNHGTFQLNLIHVNEKWFTRMCSALQYIVSVYLYVMWYLYLLSYLAVYNNIGLPSWHNNALFLHGEQGQDSLCLVKNVTMALDLCHHAPELWQVFDEWHLSSWLSWLPLSLHPIMFYTCLFASLWQNNHKPSDSLL